MPLKELLQEFVDKSYEELVDLASYSLVALCNEIEELSPEHAEISSMVVAGYLAASVAADGKITPLENKFLCEVLGMDNELADFLLALGKNPQQVELLDQLFDSASVEFKKIALAFCLSLIAIDETINRDEVAFIEKLLA